jgi:hypothetical protein
MGQRNKPDHVDTSEPKRKFSVGDRVVFEHALECNVSATIVDDRVFNDPRQGAYVEYAIQIDGDIKRERWLKESELRLAANVPGEKIDAYELGRRWILAGFVPEHDGALMVGRLHEDTIARLREILEAAKQSPSVESPKAQRKKRKSPRPRT